MLQHSVPAPDMQDFTLLEVEMHELDEQFSDQTKKSLREKCELYLYGAEQILHYMSHKKKPSKSVYDDDERDCGDDSADKNDAGGADDADGVDGVYITKQQRAASLQHSKVLWSSICGHDNIKDLLMAAVSNAVHCHAGRAILLFGPTGSGKSLCIEALVAEFPNIRLLSITTQNFGSILLGDSKRLRKIFQEARQRKPSLLFFDHLDSWFCSPSDDISSRVARIKEEFLFQLQGANSNEGVLVVATTCSPWLLDSDIFNRFQNVYVPLPDTTTRISIFQSMIRDMPHSLTSADVLELGRLTDGYSGADIDVLIREGCMKSIRELVSQSAVESGEQIMEPVVTMDDMMSAFAKCKRSMSEEELAKFTPFIKDVHAEPGCNAMSASLPTTPMNPVKQMPSWMVKLERIVLSHTSGCSVVKRRLGWRYNECLLLDERTQMFEDALAEVEHVLSLRDFNQLGRMTDGFSGSDVDALVYDVATRLLKEVQQATHFRHIRDTLHCNLGNLVWVPCDPKAPKAVNKTWTQINSQDLKISVITMTEMMLSFRTMKSKESQVDHWS